MTTQDFLIPGLASDGIPWSRTMDAALYEAARCTVGDTLQDGTLWRMARCILDQAPPQFVLAGVSMGGIVAMEVASMAPSQVTRLALVDAVAVPANAAER